MNKLSSNDKKPLHIENPIAETLLIPLYMKAKLTNQNSIIIKDSSAVDLVSKLNYNFDKFSAADMSLIGCGLRADYFDQYAIQKIEQSIQQNYHLVIISIGCGLDNRYQRIVEQTNIDKTYFDNIHFYEIDLPEVIELRSKLIPEKYNQHYIAGSMFEDKWLIDILNTLKLNTTNNNLPINVNFCFLIEGVLMYFQSEQVKSFFAMLADTLTHANKTSKDSYHIADIDIMFDATGVLATKFSKKHDAVRHMNAEFKWGMSNNEQLTIWDKRYKLQSSKYIMDIKPHLWSIKAKLIRLIPKFRKFSKILNYSIEIN
ncbi:class I SAM-dependent methyltransferase [Otariodibacter oris]|uniref:O-methyltransferase involved in polyketide biosynthesis n=1 Tax=Otariodibacter oris TaxID=1032623 RepID=A0A420XI18_9PAST|nr:class I SAM-dependent methyltransferase [Otariodibacter oris]QGM81025.1 hypothetical protein A6A10_06210 [Otariodibacter oris]RKR76791.1 O-methyltransferase involved in polyketide biosynthesis [Otariodibacter oris]